MSKIEAKIRLQVALSLARDIQKYRAGDAARFDRMVDAHGKGLISFGLAVSIIKDICEMTAGHFPLTSKVLLAWVERN